MTSPSLRLAISAGTTAIILIVGGAVLWLVAYRGGLESTGPVTATPIMVDVTAITEVVKSSVFARFVALAPEIKLGTLGNPNPFSGPREGVGATRQ